MPDTVSVSDSLRKQKDLLLQRWRDIAERDQSFNPPSRLSSREFLNDIPRLLEIFCDYLGSSRSETCLSEATDVIRRHGQERWKQQFNLEELLRDWGNLNRVVLEAVNGYFDEASPDCADSRTDAIGATSDFFMEAVCASVAHFDELRQQEASGKVHDLVQMRGYFEQIEEAQRHFLSEASHDIGGSLTAISGISELLKNDVEGGGQSALSEFGKIIDESVTAATKVLDTLLQLAHHEAGQMRFVASRVRMGEFLSESVETLAAQRGKEVVLEIESRDGWEGSIDAGKLRRTLEVLLDYAAANSGEGPWRFDCAQEEDSWSLEFRFHKPERSDDGTDDGDVSTSEHRREIDRLLLKRYCLIQNASFEIRGEQDASRETVLVLRFPYRG